jgi:hypothetical protein
MSPEKMQELVEAFQDLTPKERKIMMIQETLRYLEQGLVKCIQEGRDEDVDAYSLIAIGINELYAQDMAMTKAVAALNQPITENVVPFPGKKKSDDPTWN